MAIVPDLTPATADMYQQAQGRQPGSMANLSNSATMAANTAAIQAAIDYAWANSIQKVKLPPGIFYCDPGIYLDAPGNLRANLTSPTIFNFSLHLEGNGGLYNNEGFGTQLNFTDNTQTALIVGTGQGMRLSSFSILGARSFTSRAALPVNGIGIGLAGGSAGLSRCELDGVGVLGFRQGIASGFTGNNTLCDSVTLNKCTVFQCYKGYSILGTQNYNPTMIACEFGGNATHVYSPDSVPVTMIGGNYSTSDGKRNAFAVTSVSAMTVINLGGNDRTLQFTATLSAPDQPIADGAYDVFVMKTSAFGLVPLLLQSYNSSTGVATLQIDFRWLSSNFYPPDYLGSASIVSAYQTALQAVTTLYACETIRVLHGMCFKTDGIHVENPQTVTRLVEGSVGFGGDVQSHLDRIKLNYNIAHDDLVGGSPSDLAAFYCQQAFPFIDYVGNNGSTLKISNTQRAQTNSVLVRVDFGTSARVIFDNSTNILANVQVPSSYGNFDTGFGLNTTAHGMIEWDVVPWLNFPASSDYGYGIGLVNNVPFWGNFPAPAAQPVLTTVQLAAVSGSLGAAGTYTPLYGEKPYVVIADQAQGNQLVTPSQPTAAQWVKSAHRHWSWGQNLSNAWNYVGNSHVLNVASTALLFPGLKITLNNGGGNIDYLVTGVYPSLGYVTASRSNAGMTGTAGTLYSAATIIQEAYSLSYAGMLPAAKFTTNAAIGATTAAAGDLTGAQFVNLKLTAVGAAAYTVRTAAQMFGDIPGAYAGLSYMLAIQNTNAGTTVLTADGGATVTINGTASIAQNVTNLYFVTFPTPTTCTINFIK